MLPDTAVPCLLWTRRGAGERCRASGHTEQEWGRAGSVEVPGVSSTACSGIPMGRRLEPPQLLVAKKLKAPVPPLC